MDDKEIKERVAKFLPRALEIAIAAHKFSSVQKDKDAGTMKKHHEASKAAAAHIELLMKLARKVDVENGDIEKESGENLSELLERAKQELDGVSEN